jgi:hypothetical protein
LLNNPEEEDWAFLERMSKNSKAEESADRKEKHPISRSLPDLDSSSKDRIATLERELARLKKKDVNAVQFAVCKDCGDIGHQAENCQVNMAQTDEEMNQVYGEKKQYDMNSNTYHPGLRNHPKFKYGNASNQMNPNFQPGNQGGSSYQNRQSGNQGGYQRNYNQGGSQGYQNRDNTNYQRGYNQGGNGNGSGSSNNQGGGDDLSSKMDILLGMMKESKKENEMRDKSHEALAKQVGQLASKVAILKK